MTPATDPKRAPAWTAAVAVLWLGFFAYAVARAVRLSLTYDEAATYLRYIASSDPLAVFRFDVATNHFLNTLLTKVAYTIGGPHEVVMRLPNLIAYAAYLTFAWLILRGLRHRAIAVAGFVLLNVNPYVLDFFSLTRGYGMALGLLMGALYFLLRFLGRGASTDGPDRDLRWALTLGVGAALANFSVLNVNAGVLAVALVAGVLSSRSSRTNGSARSGQSSQSPVPAVAPAPQAAPQVPVFSRRRFPWLPVVATCFVLLVFSQNLAESPELYAPVQVGVSGVADADVASIAVFGVDLRGRSTRLTFDPAARLWRPDHVAAIQGLRIELPIVVGDRVAFTEVAIGTRVFRHGPGDGEDWTIRNDGVMRVLESRPGLSLDRSRVRSIRDAINWGGDLPYAKRVVSHAAVALGALAALALVLGAAGRIAGRAALVAPRHWRPLSSAVLWLAALVGVPLYLLQTQAQLYYGGSQGLVADTFYSVISCSFYDRTYLPAQTALTFDGVLVTLAMFAAAAVVKQRRRQLADLRAASCVLAILGVTSIVGVVEHGLFHTPYLLERTALFYLPLFVLFATFLCDAVAGVGRTAKIFAMSALAVTLSFSVYHFAATANLTSVLDWRRDADTRTMMADVGRLVASERGHGARVVLGVEWFYSAAAAFYASRNTDATIDMVVLPWPAELVYVNDTHDPNTPNVIHRYPHAGSMLVRTAPR